VPHNSRKLARACQVLATAPRWLTILLTAVAFAGCGAGLGDACGETSAHVTTDCDDGLYCAYDGHGGGTGVCVERAKENEPPGFWLDLADGRWSDAAQHLEAAARVKPDLGRVWERLGLAKLYGGDAAGALTAFERETRVNPAWRAASFRRAQALQALGRIAEARAAYEAALARDPQNAEARDSLEALRGR